MGVEPAGDVYSPIPDLKPDAQAFVVFLIDAF